LVVLTNGEAGRKLRLDAFCLWFRRQGAGGWASAGTATAAHSHHNTPESPGPVAVWRAPPLGLLTGTYSRKGGSATLHEDLRQVYALFPVLPNRAKQLAATFSGGQQQMLRSSRA
jgi:hypothetical protein